MFKKFVGCFFSFIFIASILFFIPQNDSSAATSGLRWAEVENGIPSYAYRSGAMMVQKDKITAISQLYGSLRFDGTRWETVTDPTTFPRADRMGDMFLDSRGIIYAGGIKADYNQADPLDTPESYIFESTDGLNFTPVQAFVDLNGQGIIWNFTEDEDGNVWAGEYTTKTASTGAHLWKRSATTGTWVNVATWAVAGEHVHNVYYDRFRHALYVALGDTINGIHRLSLTDIRAGHEASTDFVSLITHDPAPVEVTAITSDADYLYVGMDIHSVGYGTMTRAIARITDDGTTQSIEQVYPQTGCSYWGWADVDDAGNVIFSSTGINEWSCTSYGNKIVVSGDQGATWDVVKDFGSDSPGIGMHFSGRASAYATNWSGLYASGNGWGGLPLRAFIGRVIPSPATFYVNGTSGVDWTNFGLSASTPVKSLDYLELLDVHPGDTVQFTGTNTYSQPLKAGWGGDAADKIALRGNPVSTFTGGHNAAAPAVAENFESATSAWNFNITQNGDSTVTAETTPALVHDGAQSAKIVRGTTGQVYLELKNVSATGIQQGDTMYLSYWVYYPADQTGASDNIFLRLLDNNSPPYELRLKLYPQGTSALTNEIALNISPSTDWDIPSRHSLSSGAWHKIYIEDYLDSSAGSLKLYVDDKLWLNANGIKTVTEGKKLGSLYFWNQFGPVTYYIDDLKFGKLPLEAAGAINTADFSYLDIGKFKLAGTNGVMISAASTNIDLHDSIFNGLTVDAINNAGNSNINLFYNTIFGSGRYGIYASGAATLKNNVVYNSASDDIFTEAGAVLTGGHNWFKSAGVGGAGSYTDAGATTWSARDPLFVNSSTGDFHLQMISPLVNAGISVPGSTTDFGGNPRFQGLAPDIGAFESGVIQIFHTFLPLITK